MDNIKELHKTFLKQAHMRAKELDSKLSQYDVAITDVMHFLEIEKCDAVAMVKVAKKLKDLRAERRLVKIEKEQVDCLLAAMRAKNLDKFEHKTYTYRTTIMDDLKKR